MSDWIATRRIRCPRCRSVPRTLVEFTESYYVYNARDGAREDRIDGCAPDGQGKEIRVEALCDGCGHRWRLKGIRTVADLDGVPAEP